MSEPKDNKCEICGFPATEGIIDKHSKVRYTCQDHPMKLYEIIAKE
jgi:hypothetical protein